MESREEFESAQKVKEVEKRRTHAHRSSQSIGLAFAQPSDVPVPLKLDLGGKRGRERRRG